MLATCAHASLPLRRTPVSSLCSTGAPQRRFQFRFDRLERLGALLHPLDQRPRREPCAAYVSQQVPHPRIGHELLRHQQDRQRPLPRSILRPAGLLGGKRASGHLLARRAADMQRLVLANPQSDRR